MGTFEGEPLYYASLDSGEYRTLLDQCGCGIVVPVVADKACGHHAIWLAQRG